MKQQVRCCFINAYPSLFPTISPIRPLLSSIHYKYPPPLYSFIPRREKPRGCEEIRERKREKHLSFLFFCFFSSGRFDQDHHQMARALCNASFRAVLSGSVTRFSSMYGCPRGYSAAAEVVGRGRTAEEKAAVIGKRDEGAVSWVPDPVTGYYRPANRAGEIDAAELREMLLSQKSRD